MPELHADNIIEYLVTTRHLPPGVSATAQPLAWGVSNIVLRVEPEGLPALVVKQSQPQLRTRIEWLSRCERIFREADVLRAIAPLLPPGVIPQVRFEERSDFVLGLEAIRADHLVWKQALLENSLDLAVAATLGQSLGTIHRDTAGRPELLADPVDWSLFDELRIDPFYRWIARVHPDIVGPVSLLICEMAAHRCCLVLADFSPKNVLVHADGVSLVDFETGHYGDPAFDVGFFLSHLLLKSLRWPTDSRWRVLVNTFWTAYRRTVDQPAAAVTVDSASTSARAVRHLAACLLARIDGKSPVDYLTETWQPELVRRFALRNLQAPVMTLEHALADWFAASSSSESS